MRGKGLGGIIRSMLKSLRMVSYIGWRWLISVGALFVFSTLEKLALRREDGDRTEVP